MSNDQFLENRMSKKMKVKSGINVTKSYLFTCYKEPNVSTFDDNDNLDKSQDSSPGLTMSKLSKHGP